MIIKTRNTLTDSAQKTFLSSSIAAGATTYPVKNTTGLTTSWAAQIGETGEGQTEIVIGTNTNIGTMTGAAGSFAHAADTPIYFIKFDQIVFERSITGTTGVAAPMTNGTVGIQADEAFTLFDDTTGSSVYAYKTFFRSSGLLTNSTESDWITSSGFSFYSLGALKQRGKDRVWNAKYLSDDFLTDGINEWKDELTNSAIQANEEYAVGTVNVAFGTAGLGTITSADFKQVKRLWVTYDGANYYRSRRQDTNQMTPKQVYNETSPVHYYQGDNIFWIKPEQQGGTAQVEYYKLNARLVNDADELPTPMKGYTKSFIDYLEYLALKKDGKYAEAEGPLGEATRGKSTFIQELTPRDKTGQTYQDIREPLSGDEYFPF